MQTKKLLGSTLALGMLFPAQSFAADSLLKNFKLGGQFDMQAISAINVNDFATNGQQAAGGATNNDRIGDAQTRILLNADWDVLDDVHAKVTLRKNDRTYGTTGGFAQTAGSNSQSITAGGGTDVLGNTFVDQANVKIDKIGGHVDLTVGRQWYGTSGDMIIYFGPSDKMLYDLPDMALDAVRADWATDWGGVTAIVAKQTGHKIGVTPVGTNDIDLRGLNVALKGTDMVSGAAYLYNQVTHANGALGVAPAGGVTAGKNNNLWILGVKGKATLGMAWLSAELAKNFGENRVVTAVAPTTSRNYDGWAFKADLGAKAETGFGAVMPWLNFAYGTGDSDANSRANNGFVAINGDYRPGTIYGLFTNGYSPVTLDGANLANANAVAGNGTLTNRVIWGVGVKTTPSMLNKLTAGVSFWDFHSQTAATPVALGGGPRAFGGNKHIGSEVDLDLAWQHSENVTLGAGLADFQPGGIIKNNNSTAGATAGINNPARLGYFDVRVKF